MDLIRGVLDCDIKYIIQVGWLKRRNVTRVLCDRNIPLKFKEKIYRTVIWLNLLYDTKSWAIKKYYSQKISEIEMHILYCMCGNIRKNKVRHENILVKVRIASIEEKIQENRL